LSAEWTKDSPPADSLFGSDPDWIADLPPLYARKIQAVWMHDADPSAENRAELLEAHSEWLMTKHNSDPVAVDRGMTKCVNELNEIFGPGDGD
jgi:hypothetical protein